MISTMINPPGTFKRIFLISAVTVLAARPVDAKTISEVEYGFYEGMYYGFWKDRGSASMTLHGDGRFSCEWNDHLSISFGGIGLSPARNPVFQYSGEYALSGLKVGTLGIYGWMSNPGTEFYIVDTYGDFDPGSGGSTWRKEYGDYEVDGVAFTLTRHLNSNGLIPFDFYRFVGVRQEQLPLGSVSSTIDSGKHFRAWAEMGVPIGDIDYILIAAESYQSAGAADITVEQVAPDCGMFNSMPVCCSISADDDGDGYGAQFGADLCVVTEATSGWHPQNPEDVIAAIDVGGYEKATQYNGVWYRPSQFVSNAEPDGTVDAIEGSDNSLIYQTAGKGDVSIAIPIEGAKTVSVEMGFVEIVYWEEQDRLFDVAIEDNAVYSNVDLIKEVGRNALWKPDPVIVEVEDDLLNIEITSESSEGIISSVLVKAIDLVDDLNNDNDPDLNPVPDPDEGDTQAGAFDLWALLLGLGSLIISRYRKQQTRARAGPHDYPPAAAGSVRA